MADTKGPAEDDPWADLPTWARQKLADPTSPYKTIRRRMEQEAARAAQRRRNAVLKRATQVAGATAAAGLVADLFRWQGPFWSIGAAVLVVLIVAVAAWQLERPSPEAAKVLEELRALYDDPEAWVESVPAAVPFDERQEAPPAVIALSDLPAPEDCSRERLFEPTVAAAAAADPAAVYGLVVETCVRGRYEVLALFADRLAVRIGTDAVIAVRRLDAAAAVELSALLTTAAALAPRCRAKHDHRRPGDGRVLVTMLRGHGHVGAGAALSDVRPGHPLADLVAGAQSLGAVS